MNENNQDIIDEYFKEMEHCRCIECQKVIFEPSTKTEWFFEDDFWCYFEFFCDENNYMLRKSDDKSFDTACFIKDMSYEIKMLLAYIRLRNVVTIEKDVFSQYVNKYEKARETNKNLSVEKFNLDIKEKEEISLQKSEKIANGILWGCLVIIIFVIILFAAAIFSYIKLHYFS